MRLAGQLRPLHPLASLRYPIGRHLERVVHIFESSYCIIDDVLPNLLCITSGVTQAPVKPCELPDDVHLIYVDDRGSRRTLALEDAADVDFGLAKAFGKSPAYRGQRNFPGWWWSATTRSHVLYKSWLERHHVIEADRDPHVVAILGQPFELTWPEGNKQVRHVPALLCRMLEGQVAVTDCHSASKVDEKFEHKAAVTAAACGHIGWDYRLVGAPDTVWAANLRWPGRGRAASCGSSTWSER
jgi:hypothetical protein